MVILEVELQTDDIIDTDGFYSQVLGLPVKNRGQDSISFLAGESLLTFVKSNHVSPTYHFAFNIPNNKFDEAVLWATSKFKLIEIEDHNVIADFRSWNAKAFYFQDNNKNILEFIARFDLNNQSDRPFNSDSILSISEIGIVTNEPLEFADKLVKEIGIPFFIKSKKSESFVPLGDDNGLLIIVKTDRNWYPTNQQSKQHYSKIKILEDEITRTIKTT